MSAKKRRVNRRVALLVRMDVTHHLCQLRWLRPYRSDSFVQAKANRIEMCMCALGHGMNANEQKRAEAAINAMRKKMFRCALK